MKIFYHFRYKVAMRILDFERWDKMIHLKMRKWYFKEYSCRWRYFRNL